MSVAISQVLSSINLANKHVLQYLVENRFTRNQYALKKIWFTALDPYSIKTDDDFKNHVQKEIDLVNKMAHVYIHCPLAPHVSALAYKIQHFANRDQPNIVPYLHHQGGEDGKAVEIFMPVYEGSLRGRIQHVRASQKEGGEVRMEWARGMFVQILTALNHIHSHQNIHRDMKPDNILFRGDNWVLADFGIAKPINTSGSRDTKIGTDMYAPPEYFSRGRQTPAYDIYGLGLCLLECFMQLSDEKTRSETDDERHRRYQRLMRQYVPNLKKMLRTSHKNRPSAEELLEGLRSLPTVIPLTSRWHRLGNTTTSLQTLHEIQEGEQKGETTMEVDCQPYTTDMSWEQTMVEIPHQQRHEHTGFGTVQVQTIVVPQRNKQWWDLSPGGPSEFFVSAPKSSARPLEPPQVAPQPNTAPGCEPGQRQGATNTRASLRLGGNSPEASTLRTCPKRPGSPTSLGTLRRTKRNKTVPTGM